jgi:hypothetical protein
MQRASRLGGAGPKPVPPDAPRKLSPWLFAVVVVCFFLPFVTCNGVTATGMQAATGLSPPGSDRAAVEAFRGQTAVPNPFALLALLFALSGLVLAAIWGLKGLVTSAVAAVTGTLSLGRFVVYVLGQTHLDVTIEIGLNLTFLAFLVAAALNDYHLARVPHLVAGDGVGLRSQGARPGGGSRRWAPRPRSPCSSWVGSVGHGALRRRCTSPSRDPGGDRIHLRAPRIPGCPRSALGGSVAARIASIERADLLTSHVGPGTTRKFAYGVL